MSRNKPWLQNYDPGVPDHIEYPDMCIHEFLFKQAKDYPESTAIIEGEREISYKTLSQCAFNFAKNLTAEGLQSGDRVGICLPNTIDFAIAFFGILAAGGIVTALNPMFPRRELEFQVKKAAPRLIVSASDRLEDFQEITRTTALEKIIVVQNISQEAIEEPEKSETNQVLQFSKMTRNTNPGVDLPKIMSTQPAVFQFSGGTTGTPKAAIGTHRNIIANVSQFKHWLVNLKDGTETFLVVIPLYHVYGMVLGLNLGLAMGARMVFIRDPRNMEEILNAIQKFKVSYLPAVPSTFRMIIEYPGVSEGKFNLSGIKACISGSAPLSENIRVLFERYTGGRLVEGYGLSEAPTATHCNPILGENRKGSIGLPLPDVDCRIVKMGAEDEDVNPGEVGELLIQAPQVMQGYFGEEIESQTALHEGWLRTGDIARMDKKGYFYILGRSKELIKVHGLQVWPAEVEEVIQLHPAVKECAAAGVPDEHCGERVKIWVVPNEGVTISLQELCAFCREKLARYKIPQEVEIINAIPRSSVGKVLRRELVRMHNETLR